MPTRTDASFDVNLFQTAIGPRNFLTIEAPDVPGHKQLGFGLVASYQLRPYIRTSALSGTPLAESNIVDEHYATELTAAIGLRDRFQAGVAVPFTLSMNGDLVDQTGMRSSERLEAVGLGDLRLEGKALLATLGEDEELTLGASAGISLPTGRERAYLGDKTVTGRIKALAGFQLGKMRAGGNLGILLRQLSETFSAKIGHQLLYGAAASYQLHKRVEGIIEAFGRSGLTEFADFYWDVNPFEVDVAARVTLTHMWAVTGGGGKGIGKGIGAPQWRGFLAASFTPDFRDRDRDGVYDVYDKCPDQSEDRDGFQDNDGCPELDNDNDGVADAQDRCVNQAEDLDQVEDEDGCPDNDNDKDGITDINDACPNAQEDGKGKRPKDGCPSSAEDSDGDGVNDVKDQCPEEPEDQDRFQDDDGCPEPDNDNDGIPDNFDNCANDPEDPDSFEDEDGCPDPDNDKDGFSDAQDKCPGKAETLNGKQDEDGCPDPGAEIVRLGTGQIDVDERIAFVARGGKTELKGNAAAALGLVALILKGHPEIKKLRIEVRAEGVVKEETQRRAELIRDALAAKGIDPGRLAPLGMGSGTARVDFLIESLAATPKPGQITGPAEGQKSPPADASPQPKPEPEPAP